jgi:hypothetical protein
MNDSAQNLDNKQIDTLIKEILAKNNISIGNRLAIFSNIYTNVDNADKGFSFAQLFRFADTLITNSRFLTVVAESASTLSIFLEPVADMISVINAWESGRRMYAFRAIAYTVTAWSFNQPVPTGSQVVLGNLTTGILAKPRSELLEYNKIWKETSRKVLLQLESSASMLNVPKDAVKIIMQGIGKNDPRTLCKMLLKGLEVQLQPIPRISWKSGYNILYPF